MFGVGNLGYQGVIGGRIPSLGSTDRLLQEDGDRLLLESGFFILLE